VTTKGGAVFLDRDNTIVADPGYLHDPGNVALLPGAAEGLAAMAAAGWPLVVVSNQSGIARGLFGPEAFHAVLQRTEALLAPQGVHFLASYFCPHHPEFGGPCDCRKPGVLLFRQAAAEHGLVLGESWFVGDRWRDVQPALKLGGRGILVDSDPLSPDAHEAFRHACRVVPDLVSAARLIGRRA
jgi:histidinol-phosphate phosphatase family protein